MGKFGVVVDKPTVEVRVEETVTHAVVAGSGSREANAVVSGLMTAAQFRKLSRNNNMIDFVRPDVSAIYTPGPNESLADVIDRCLTGALDCQPAIQALLDLTTIAAPRGKACDLPDGDLRIDRPIRVRRGAILRGQGGAIRAPATRLLPHTNTFSAFIVVSGYTPDPGGGRGGGSYICDLGVDYQGAYAERVANHAYAVGDVMISKTTDANHLCQFVCTQAGTTASGNGPALAPIAEGATVADGTVVWTATVISAVRVLERCFIERLYVNAPPGNGCTVSASVPVGNANNFVLRDWRIDSPGGNGIYIDGSDVNAGKTDAIDVGGARFWAIFDSSFLGNSHYDASAADCGLGPYKSDNPNATNTFYNCYSESGQPPSDLLFLATAISGQHGAGFTARSRVQIANKSTPEWQVTGPRAPNGVSMSVAICESNDAVGQTILHANPLDAESQVIVDTDYRLKYQRSGPGGGCFREDLDNFDGYVSRLLATPNQPDFPAASQIFPCGIAIGGAQTSYVLAPFIDSGAAAPSAGKWKVSDRRLNTAPSELGATGSKYILDGWICVTAGDFAGTPPIFKEQRTLTGG
jgi:hypothetical protein